jgi:hypothetical protein
LPYFGVDETEGLPKRFSFSPSFWLTLRSSAMMSSARLSLLAAAMAVGGFFASPAYALTATAQPALLNGQAVATPVEQVGYRRYYYRPYRHYYHRRYYRPYYRPYAYYRPYYRRYAYYPYYDDDYYPYGYGYGYPYGYAPVVGLGIGFGGFGWGWGGHRWGHWGGGHWGHH